MKAILMTVAMCALIWAPLEAQTVEPETIAPVELEIGGGASFEGNESMGDTTRAVGYVKLGYRHRWSDRRFATGVGFKYDGMVDVDDLERFFAYFSWDTFGSTQQQFTLELRFGYSTSPDPFRGKFTVEPLLRFSVDAFSDEVSLFATVGITGNGSNMGELLTLNPDTIDGQAYGGIRLVPKWAR